MPVVKGDYLKKSKQVIATQMKRKITQIPVKAVAQMIMRGKKHVVDLPTIDPMQTWPLLIFGPQNKHLSAELKCFALKIKSKCISVWSFKVIFLSNSRTFILSKT